MLVAGVLTALLTAAYATRLWLMAFRGRGAAAPHHGKEPVAMTGVLWLLAIPTIGLGLAADSLADWFGGRELTPTLVTSVLGTGAAVIGVMLTYALWQRATVKAATVGYGAGLSASAAAAESAAETPEVAEVTHDHPAVPAGAAPTPARRSSARCTATRPTASTSTPSTTGSSSAPSARRQAWSASSTARSWTRTSAARAPEPGCSAASYAVPRPATCRAT